jgi:mono/diheme cytochrome c family protein
MADDGAQLYWLHCQPCHGDRGQGLTDAPDDDWRAQYPPGDQNCWESGCHGERPYENGFTIPRTIPALIGEGSLANYGSMAQVHAFMRAAMPRQAPASLTDAEYLAIAAFLARANGLSDGVALTEVDLSTMVLNPAYMVMTATPAMSVSPTAPAFVPVPPATTGNGWRWLVGGMVTIILVSGGVLWLRRNH